jgi:hypothetical protein
MMFFVLSHCVDWLVEANILEKFAGFIFSPGLFGRSQSTQQLNPKEHHQNCHYHENLKSHK